MLWDKLFPKTPMLDTAKKKVYSLPLLLELAVFLLIFFVPELISALISVFLLSPLVGDVQPLSPISLFLTGITVASVLLYCRLCERRSFKSLGFVRRRGALEYAVGFALGVLMFSLVALICALFGGCVFTLSDNLPSLLPTLALFLVGFAVQGLSEEVLCRSYLLNSLAAKQKAPVAVAVSAVAFSLLHISNPSVTPIALVNIALFGIFAGVYFWRRANIWGIAALHTAWNFAEGNIFGINISGIAPTVSVFNTTTHTSLSLINGGAFGAEGGIAVTLVLLIATIGAFFVPTNN